MVRMFGRHLFKFSDFHILLSLWLQPIQFGLAIKYYCTLSMIVTEMSSEEPLAGQKQKAAEGDTAQGDQPLMKTR